MGLVYVFCPARIISGGPEALHQLVDGINHLGGNAFIVYVDNGEICSRKINPPQRYQCYKTPVINKNSIVYSRENRFVVPESMPELLQYVTTGMKYLWWLSVGFRQQDFDYSTLRDTIHLYQSEHARAFVQTMVNPTDLLPLSDYVVAAPVAPSEKKNKIALVERKLDVGYKDVVDALQKQFDVQLVRGLSRYRLARLLSSSKIFVDFGNHPGKDRLPREAALFDNIVITSNLGACENEIDVPIPKKYKLDNSVSFKNLNVLVQSCLTNHMDVKKEFNDYREEIGQEKHVFFSEINSVFGLNQTDDVVQSLTKRHNPVTSTFHERLSESTVMLKFKKLIEYIRIVVVKRSSR